MLEPIYPKFFTDEDSQLFWKNEIKNFEENVAKLIEKIDAWEDDETLKNGMIENIESIFSSDANGYLDDIGERFFNFLNEYILMTMFPLIVRQSNESTENYFIRIFKILLEKNKSFVILNLSYYEEFLGLDTLPSSEEDKILSRDDIEILEQVVKVFNNKNRRVNKVENVRERAIFGYNRRMTEKFREIHEMVGFVASQHEEHDNLRGRTYKANHYRMNPIIEPILSPFGDLTVGLLMLIYMAYLSVNRNQLTHEIRNHLLEFLSWSLIFGIVEGNTISDLDEPEISKNIKIQAMDFSDVIYSLERFLAYMIGRDNWLQSLYGSSSKDRRKRIPSKLIRVRGGDFLIRNNSIRAALSSIRIKPGLGGE